LRRVGEVAAGEGKALYLVGGAVRDLALRAATVDLDLVAEADAIRLAETAAAALGGGVRAHGRFGTATLTLPDGQKVDFATARRETYPRPGALPSVFPASIEEDLRRRDFTLNAMALSLSPATFGGLLDPAGGWPDLEAGCVRVLHPSSFVDDPTRVIRAARFEVRFGFRMDPATEAGARAAVASGCLATLTPERLRDALFRLFAETDWPRAVQRLEALGFWAWFIPGLRLDPQQAQRAAASIRWWKAAGLEPLNEPLVAMTAILAAGGEPAAGAAAARLRLGPAEANTLLTGLRQAAGQREAAAGMTPSRFTRWLAKAPPEALVYLLSRAVSAGERERMERYLNQWRHIRLEISGLDLLAEGWDEGPELGAVLRAALDARLDECIMGRTAELEFARAWRSRRAAGDGEGP
jgi:tRNA nucleotidyltransferase (CCA-adding enzyme)